MFSPSAREEGVEQIEKALPKVCRASVGESHVAGKTVAEDKVAFGGGKIREFAARGASVDLVEHGRVGLCDIGDVPERDRAVLRRIRAEGDGDARAVRKKTAAIAAVGKGLYLSGGKVADALLNHGDVGVLCADKVHPRGDGEREQYDQDDDADGQAGAAFLATVLDLLRVVGDGGRVDGLRGGEKLLAFHPRERFAAAGADFEMIVHESAARVRAAFVGVER